MPIVLHVVGARPNFMKIAPLIAALRAHPGIEQRLVHTGQHYDHRMAKVFFEELGLPRPDRDLGVGSGSHAEQTAAVMVRFEQVLLEERPDLVVVVGDVNSTLAAALVAAKLHIPVAHVESGLRSFDMTMPEEINRLLTDRLSTILLVPSADGAENLRREGMPEASIFVVGNLMIDTLLQHRATAPWEEVRRTLGLEEQRYAVLTLHRPANVDDPARLRLLIERLRPVTAHMPVIFPIHPRTAARFAQAGITPEEAGLRPVEPLGYREFLALMDHAGCVLTDSGGIQEETTVLGVPCFTLRDNTERPITISEGTNTLVMADARLLADAFADFVATGGKRGRVPAGWDGASGVRAAAIIAGYLDGGSLEAAAAGLFSAPVNQPTA
ncbi:MAG TPA: UDP-N-acetylglucosamine 2-epimerase (non-hydrolyzing) [Vicinamibacterales bacterium]